MINFFVSSLEMEDLTKGQNYLNLSYSSLNFAFQANIVFMGTSEFAVPVLESLVDSAYHLAAVYTQLDKPAGRGKQITSPPVKDLALKYGIPVLQSNTLMSGEAMNELAGFEPDLIVVAALGQILPGEVLSLPRFACLNVHPSLLPRHRGPSPVANALLCGDQVTGVTIMLMDVGMDSGPILAQREIGISLTDTTGILTPRLAHTGAGLLLDVLPRWLASELEPQAQDERQATYSKLISKEDGEIDWSLSAVELWRQVRAYDPWPGSYTWWKGRRLKLYEVSPFGEVRKGQVGEVLPLPETPFKVGVVTGRGILGLAQVQLEGKRKMRGEEFILGQRNFVGSILG